LRDSRGLRQATPSATLLLRFGAISAEAV
jgi:hypothetical protein